MSFNPQLKRNQPEHRAWQGVLILSLFFLVFLPAKEHWFPDTHESGYLALMSLLPKGIYYTLLVTSLGSLAAVGIGFILGFGKLSTQPAINILVSFYIETLRGLPLLVLLFYIYYALGEFFHTPPLVAAVLGFGLSYGAYMADVIRAGLESVPKEQMEAARSIGMDYRQAMRYIILPQAGRTILPALGNQTLGMLKDTSLVSVLAISDILRVGNEQASLTFNYFEIYTYIALVYLALTLVLSKGLKLLEKKLAYPGSSLKY